MKRLLLILLLFPVCGWGQMLVFTMAGSSGATALGDGGPATAAGMHATEGIWLDNRCSLYITDLGNNRIRKVDLSTNTVVTVAGNGSGGFFGDGGPATNAQIKPYGLYVDSTGNIFIADAGNNRIRKVDALTRSISTFAGGGSAVGDGGPATNAMLIDPPNVYGDKNGNVYIGEKARIRKVNASGIITTIAGNGLFGFSGDGDLATNAQVYYPTSMLLDEHNNLLFADRGNSRIRKIDATTGVITTIAGTTNGYSGDGGLATNAQLYGPLSFVIDNQHNIVIGDNGNNVIRKIDATTNIITTIAGVGPSTSGDLGEGVAATAAEIHPEFLYLDQQGNIYFSNFGKSVKKITNYLPGFETNSSNCIGTKVISLTLVDGIMLYPNPAQNELTIESLQSGQIALYNTLGQMVLQQRISSEQNKIDISRLPGGVYVLRVVMEDGSMVVRRVVKE